jgi:hypothetical protein
MTVLEHIVASLRVSADYNKHDVAPPAVILWTDGQRLWESVAGRIGECLDRFYILSPEVSGTNAGPSTWIRYHLTADAAKEGIPVIYLPGISRLAFRSPIGFPEEAKHLFALQFLGQFWTQINGKDWTPAAMMSSADGRLGLDLAKDSSTVQALATQLGVVLDTPVATLQGRRLEAADFNTLAVADPAGMLLRWMADPDKVKTEWPAERMAAFQAICQQQYQFSPASDGRLVAAEKLIVGEGAWKTVWDRFEESPATYRGVRDALASVSSIDLFVSRSPRLPQNNQQAEDRLRKVLHDLATKPPRDLLGELVKLANDNRQRAASIWASLGEAPLAQGVAHLGRMAQAIQQGLSGTDWDGIAKAYLHSGWQVDAEARRSFAAVRKKVDVAVVSLALREAYLPWLEQQAIRVTAWASDYPNGSKASARRLTAKPGTVYLFVDGLRTDVALELSAMLDGSGAAATTGVAWAPLPTVTTTAKPGWNPLAESLSGETLGDSFDPQVAETGRPLTTEGFRARISELGFVWFSGAETGDSSGCGWTETADFDSRGHDEGAKFVWRIDEELNMVRQRITELLQAGWNKVVVITDHGWLWMPGGLPKTDLPAHLTASKWGRCAVPQPDAQHHCPTAPWFWANQHHVILAPGVNAFRNGVEYGHGGLTLQEALTLTITVSASQSAELATVAITSVRWLGLRLNVEVQGGVPDLSIDVRTKAADASTSLLGKTAARPPIRTDGKASIIIANDDYAGTSATLVVLHRDAVVAKRPVTVGEN